MMTKGMRYLLSVFEEGDGQDDPEQSGCHTRGDDHKEPGVVNQGTCGEINTLVINRNTNQLQH